ncbi:energy-coupling factor transporter ATPase [Salinithrix halophila]|uniref:Energy-coupling factor transporter ATP-binding protein EcfA2 n=1 Tax=Salinithrix halophila TaxID=1485204 RepID=A0ABV8JCD2_9BACL
MGIAIQGLSHVYMAGTPFEKIALSRVNMEVEEGAFAAVLGATGSGKSTLIQHIAGLLHPTEGTVRVFEAESGPETKKLGSLRRQVGVVFQYPEYQLFEETVAKDIAYGPRNQGLEEGEIEERVRQAMEWVGLPAELRERSPFHLSGGQMRRTAIAGVLAMKPKVLVLDEPTAGLDPAGQQELLNRIDDVHREQGMTVILVSHRMEEAVRYADTLFIMDQGRLVLSGPPSEVFSRREALSEWGLEAPAATQLAAVLSKHLEPGVPSDLLTVEALEEYLWKRWTGRKIL